MGDLFLQNDYIVRERTYFDKQMPTKKKFDSSTDYANNFDTFANTVDTERSALNNNTIFYENNDTRRAINNPTPIKIEPLQTYDKQKVSKIKIPDVFYNTFPKEGDGWISATARKYGYVRTADFLRDDWTASIARKIGLDGVADWLEDKDKVCTDGVDDGKLSLKEGAWSLTKGLIGGIPKAMLNHPLSTLAAICFGAVASGPTLLIIGAIGVAAGLGIAGYGLYKAFTAKTDGDAKYALETLGMGITTTAISVASADKALGKAFEAGVKSAEVPENANTFTKTVQMFKALPESVKLCAEDFNFKYNIISTKVTNSNGKIIQRNYPNGAYKKYDVGINGKKRSLLTEARTPGGGLRTYEISRGRIFSHSYIKQEAFPNGCIRTYDASHIILKPRYLSEEIRPDGTIIRYARNGKVIETIAPENPPENMAAATGRKRAWLFGKKDKYVIKKSLEVATNQIKNKLSINQKLKPAFIKKPKPKAEIIKEPENLNKDKGAKL